MKADAVVKEYVKRISDDELAFLGIRFKQSLCGDKSEIALKLAEDEEVDKWLSSSTSSVEWFEMVDAIGECVKSEYNRRWDESDRPKKRYVRRDS